MTEIASKREHQWLGLFAMLFVATALGAWGFGHSVTLGVNAEEMRYVPVHDAEWTSQHTRLVTGAANGMHLAIRCFLIAVVTAFLLFRSAAKQKTRLSPIVVGLVFLIGTCGALLIGLIDS